MILSRRSARIFRSAPADPAVNTSVEFTVPTGVLWRPIAGQVALTTAAISGAAYGYFAYLPATGPVIWEWDSGTDQGPGKTGYYYLGAQTGFYTNTHEPSFNIPLPDVLLSAGQMVQYWWYDSSGDVQLTFASLTVEEFVLGY